jgi:hypothetical protein
MTSYGAFMARLWLVYGAIGSFMARLWLVWLVYGAIMARLWLDYGAFMITRKGVMVGLPAVIVNGSSASKIESRGYVCSLSI